MSPFFCARLTADSHCRAGLGFVVAPRDRTEGLVRMPGIGGVFDCGGEWKMEMVSNNGPVSRPSLAQPGCIDITTLKRNKLPAPALPSPPARATRDRLTRPVLWVASHLIHLGHPQLQLAMALAQPGAGSGTRGVALPLIHNRPINGSPFPVSSAPRLSPGFCTFVLLLSTGPSFMSPVPGPCGNAQRWRGTASAKCE